MSENSTKKAAKQLGRLGGIASARSKTPEQRSKLAQKAATARWSTKK